MLLKTCRLGLLLILSTLQGISAFHSLNLNAPRPGGVGGLTTSTSSQAVSTANEETKSSRWSWLLRRRSNKHKSIDFDSILQSRRTINSFLPDLPNNWEADLENSILSAVYAPNHKRTEPWRFHLLGKEAIRKVCKLNASIVADKKGEKAGEKKLKRWLEMPGWLVVTCQTSDGDGSMDKPASIDREDYAACCCAVQNLCLSLHHAGMGTKWTTGPVNFDPRFSEIVGLDKNEYVVGTIWFGTPSQLPSAPVKKQSMEEVFIRHD